MVAGFQQTSPVVTCFLHAAPVPAPFTTGSTHAHRLPTGSNSSTPYSTRSTHEFLSYREHTSLPISHRDQPRVLCPSGFSTSLFHSKQWQSLSRWDHLLAVITCMEIKPDLRGRGISFLHGAHGPRCLILIRFTKGASMPAGFLQGALMPVSSPCKHLCPSISHKKHNAHLCPKRSNCVQIVFNGVEVKT